MSLLVIGPCFSNTLKIGVNAPVSVRLRFSPLSHGSGGRRGLPFEGLSFSLVVFQNLVCSRHKYPHKKFASVLLWLFSSVLSLRFGNRFVSVHSQSFSVPVSPAIDRSVHLGTGLVR